MLRLATLIVVPTLCLTTLVACGEDDTSDALPKPAPDETTVQHPLPVGLTVGR